MPNNISLRFGGVDDSIAYVTLDRPEKLNGLTLDMLGELITVGNSLRKNKALRAVVLDGAGGTFSSGLDFASAFSDIQRVALMFAPRPWRGTNNFQECAWVWRRLAVPVIAVITGRCYGGGLQIALGADFRFTTPDADFAILEAKWGLIPDMSATGSLPQLLPLDVAKKLTMTGETFSGTVAAEVGLVTGVSDDPYAAAEELIAAIVTRSPDSVAASKRLLEATWSRSPGWSFPTEWIYQARLMAGKNFSAARAAAAKKAAPVFGPRVIR